MTNGSSSQARRQLEEFQQQEYQSRGLPPPHAQNFESLIKSTALERASRLDPRPPDREIDLFVRRKIQEIGGLLSESPPTRFENLSSYINLLLLGHQLEQSARNASEGVILARPVFGTVPWGGVNALTLRDGGEYIVAFSLGLFSFAELSAWAVARTLRHAAASKEVIPGAAAVFEFSTSPAAVKEAIQRDHEGIKIFVEGLLSYVRWGRPDNVTLPALDTAGDALASMVNRHFLQFVLAHEYGHLFHKHLERPDVVGNGSEEAGAGRVNWNGMMEAEADVAACGLMFAASMAGPQNLPVALTGIETFLSCDEALDRALSLLCVGDEDHWIAGSHPPARARREFLRQHLLSRSHEFLDGPGADAQMRSALEQGAWFSRVMDMFWELARPYVWQLYEIGLEPAGIFKRTSDSKSSDPAMLGEQRNVLRAVFPRVREPFEHAEALIVAGKALMRASAQAVFNAESPSQQVAEAGARPEIGAALAGLGRALALNAIALRQLRSVLVAGVGAPPDPFQAATEQIALAGETLAAAELHPANATVVWESGRLLNQAGQSLMAIEESSGVGVHLAQTGECLGLASEGLARNQLIPCWRVLKLAGSSAVLSGECVVRGALGLWKSDVGLMTGGLLMPIAAALRQDQPPDLDSLSQVLAIAKEVEYALASSLRRSASFLQNVHVPLASAAANNRKASAILKQGAVMVARVAGSLGQAETALRQRASAGGAADQFEGAGRMLETAGQFLSEAARQEQQFMPRSVRHDLAIGLTLAGKDLRLHKPLEAAQSIDQLVAKLL